MNPTSIDDQPEQPTPHEVDVEEMPVREDETYVEAPVPKRVTRELDGSGAELADKVDSRHGDEGIDDPLPNVSV